jgi:hypothetical protein
MAKEFGPHWQRKMKTCFQRLNANKTGKMQEADFNAFADRFIEVGKLTGKDAQDMREYYKGVFTAFFKAKDKNEGTYESLLENLKTLGKSTIIASTTDLHNRYFTNVDHNKDDVLEQEGFTKYFYILGFNADMAKKSFEAIDSNKDGKISREEFISAMTNFFTGEQENKAGDLFFGPLVN